MSVQFQDIIMLRGSMTEIVRVANVAKKVRADSDDGRRATVENVKLDG